MFGLAFPISLQVISKIDEKYSSESIMEYFSKEFEWSIFRLSLILALISLAVFGCRNVFNFSLRFNHLWIWLIFILTIILSVSFFFFVTKIFIYFSQSRLKAYLLQRSKKEEVFYQLKDLLRYGLKNDPDFISWDLIQYFDTVFEDYRERWQEKIVPLVYSEELYKLITDINRTIYSLSRDTSIIIQQRTIGGEWLLGGENPSKLSGQTYSVLWSGLSKAVEKERGSLIFTYWKVAYSFIEKELRPLLPIFEGDVKKNHEDVKTRDEERQNFFDFNYALGGMLMYRKMYETIQRIMFYSTSIPPRYNLFPYSMTEVFRSFLKFWDIGYTNFPAIDFRFPYPDLDGVMADGYIKFWTCNYIVVLYIRLFHITSWSYGYNPLNKPHLHQEESEAILANLDYFKEILKKLLTNTDLMKVLSFTSEQRRQDPLVYLENLEKALSEG